MKNQCYLLLILITSLILLGACNNDTKKEAENLNSESKDRNMFGQGLERGVILNTENAEPGYIMFCVTNSPYTYLINRAGELVHQWKSNYGVMGAYLNEDGSINVNAADPDFPVFAGGGETGRLQKINWDGKILWDFEYANEEYHAHHDFAVMPNGNVLAIAWESKTYEESLKAGRKPEMIPKSGLWPDKIVEIRPTDKTHGEIVWEWHMWDHMIQDYDPSLSNYGNPEDHPELLDINLGRPLPPPITQDSMDIIQAQGRAWRNQTAYNRGSDVYHVNAIHYNADLDQIVFSSPSLGEIFIIDHSTTTKEAAGHTGGRWGKGGDYLYRWGNPQNYGRGDSTDHKLFGQHDVRWIEKGKPGEGHLTIFNNDVPNGPDSLDYSAVYEIVPPIDNEGNYIIEKGNAYGPQNPVWVYTAPDTLSFYSSFISGAHRMGNGNTFINEGARGRYFEVTPAGEKVWEYLNPYRGNIHKPNGDPVPPVPFTHISFRSTFVAADHPALKDKKLNPISPQPEHFVLKMPPKNQ